MGQFGPIHIVIIAAVVALIAMGLMRKRAAPVSLGTTPDVQIAGASQARSRLAAALLAIILGGLGAHKFYLGRPGVGLLYLLFCWTFVPSLIGLVEGLMLLSMNEQAFHAKYG